MMKCEFVPLSHYDWSLHPALVASAIPWNPTVYCLIAAFCGVALWMTVELTLQIFFTFKRRKGLYFYSLLVCTWGIAFHVIGLILKLFNDSNWIISSIIFKIGWVSNVTGFSFVLYSRLGLVVKNRILLRAILAMIITDAICFHSPIIIFDFGISSPHPHAWVEPMQVMERIQVTGFSVQETIISVLYIYHTWGFLKDTYTRQTHRVMQLLIFTQAVAILFDATLTTVDWNDMFTLKIIIHPFVYAIKLKLEFVVLNQLLALIKHGLAPGSFPAPDEESPDATDPVLSRSGKHVPFFQSDTTAVTGGEKSDPNSVSAGRVIGRDMQYPPPACHSQDPDIILPSPPPGPSEDLPIHEVSTPYIPTNRPPSPRSRRSFEPHMPPRSMSDPTPLVPGQRDRNSDEIVAEIERLYLGRFGMESPNTPRRQSLAIDQEGSKQD